MEITDWCRIPQTIGRLISHDHYLKLANGYAQFHPTEQKSVFIPIEFVLETLEKFPNVTGMRFMYGQQIGADPGARTILLMACDNKSSDRHVPNLILVRKGYLTDTGERLTLDQCWDLLNRHVDRMCALMPEQARKDIPRATFFGINTIKSLLDTPGCAGIQYHFGYDPAKDHLPDRYESVMEAVDKDRQSLNVYLEQGQHCPYVCASPCPPPVVPVGWPFIGFYEGNEQVPEGTLYEMFHYVSPPLFEAIQDKQLYREQFSECFALVETGDIPEAKKALRRQLENMMEKYLFGDQ